MFFSNVVICLKQKNSYLGYLSIYITLKSCKLVTPMSVFRRKSSHSATVFRGTDDGQTDPEILSDRRPYKHALYKQTVSVGSVFHFTTSAVNLVLLLGRWRPVHVNRCSIIFYRWSVMFRANSNLCFIMVNDCCVWLLLPYFCKCFQQAVFFKRLKHPKINWKDYLYHWNGKYQFRQSILKSFLAPCKCIVKYNPRVTISFGLSSGVSYPQIHFIFKEF